MPVTDATQQRLLEAAEQVFADKGYAAASVREICKRAGANIAAVNYYFGDKERLYIEAVKFANRGCIQGEPFPDWPAGVSPAEKLRDFIRVMMARVLHPQSPSSMQLMMSEMAKPTKACEEIVREYIRPIADKLRDILAELLPDTPLQQRTLIAFSIVGQCHFYRNQRAIAALLVGEEEFAKFDVEVVSKHITAFTLNALGLAEKSARGERGALAPRGK
jgi:TetR/AcrR family transcriptional regulator, regulator of cefoperazone and chloramphenicol sensitivity